MPAKKDPRRARRTGRTRSNGEDMDFLKSRLEQIATKKATKRIVAAIITAALMGLGLSSDLAQDVGREVGNMVEF